MLGIHPLGPISFILTQILSNDNFRPNKQGLVPPPPNRLGKKILDPTLYPTIIKKPDVTEKINLNLTVGLVIILNTGQKLERKIYNGFKTLRTEFRLYVQR